MLIKYNNSTARASMSLATVLTLLAVGIPILENDMTCFHSFVTPDLGHPVKYGFYSIILNAK